MENVDVCNLALIQLGQLTITALTDENENARRCNVMYEPTRDALLEKHPWRFATEKVTLVDITKPGIDIWVTATAYEVGDVVEYATAHYTCLVAHTSDVFTVDLASADWELTTDWATATTYPLGTKVYHTGVHYSCVELHTSGTWATDLAATKWVVTIKPEYDFTNTYRLPTDNLRVLALSQNIDYKIEGGYLFVNASTLKIKYIAKKEDPDDYSPSFVTALAAAVADKIAFAVTNNNRIVESAKDEAKIRKIEALGTDAQGSGTPDEPKSDEWLNVR